MSHNPFASGIKPTNLDLGVYPDVGMRFRDRYTLLKIIGHGGMGVVYKAYDEEASNILEHDVFCALKVLSPELVHDERAIIALKREALLAQNLSHDNIINVLGFDHDSKWTYVLMEYLEGKPLSTLLAHAEDGVPFATLKPLLKPIAQALTYAHKQHLIHRDIKPSNIFLCNDQRVVVIDFGLSYEANKSLSRLSNTSGTSVYMPPEAHFGGNKPSAKNDIYALAVSIYELLTGTLPYQGHFCAHRDANTPLPRKPSTLNDAQWQTLLKALHYDPKQRSASVIQFIADLCDTASSVGESQNNSENNTASAKQQADNENKTAKQSDSKTILYFMLALIIAGGYFAYQALPIKTQVEAHAQALTSEEIAQRLWAWADEFEIPAEVMPRNKSQLLALRVLDLNPSSLALSKYKNLPKITYLPPEIGQLKQLQVLSVGSNKLSSLPPEIGQLSQLQALLVEDNQLSTLPAEIWQLRQLQDLHLYSNQLSALPAEIGQLSQLQRLYVSGNQLSILPAEIGQLSQLLDLSVWDNKLSALPAEIGQLSQLQTLDVQGNQLSALPTSISRLTKLEWLALEDNPHLRLSPEQEAFIKTIKNVKR